MQGASRRFRINVVRVGALSLLVSRAATAQKAGIPRLLERPFRRPTSPLPTPVALSEKFMFLSCGFGRRHQDAGHSSFELCTCPRLLGATLESKAVTTRQAFGIHTPSSTPFQEIIALPIPTRTVWSNVFMYLSSRDSSRIHSSGIRSCAAQRKAPAPAFVYRGGYLH